MKIKDLFKELFAICILVPLLHNFCSADYEPTIYNTTMIYQLNSSNSYQATFNLSGYDLLCLGCYSASTCRMLGIEINGTVFNHHMTVGGSISCTNLTGQFYFYKSGTSSGNIPLYWITLNYPNNCPTCPTCPTCPDQYTSLECQTEYNLIPISSVDQNYCTTNDLCPASGGGESSCGTGDSNWSALYINDIQHLGKPIISIDIPEEINWDYSSTDSEFNVEVIGYNVDYEKMNQVLSIQKYIPSSEDFTQVVGILAPYMKILVFVLFVYIVIRRLKKPFSSKMK